MVDRYVTADITNTAAAAILFHRLNLLLSIFSVILSVAEGFSIHATYKDTNVFRFHRKKVTLRVMPQGKISSVGGVVDQVKQAVDDGFLGIALLVT